MTDGFKRTAGRSCWQPPRPRTGSAASTAGRPGLSQMRHSPSAAVRVTAWLLTQLHQPGPGPDGNEPRRQGPSCAAARGRAGVKGKPMNDHITIAIRHRLADRATGPIALWQRWLLGRLQAGDTFARQAGWTIMRIRFGGRTYRDPRFGQLSVTRTPGPPYEPARRQHRVRCPPGAPARRRQRLRA
jgi:hypothetical protein